MSFLQSQAVYAQHGVPLFPMHLDVNGSKKPLVRNYQRIGSAASARLTNQFGDAAAFGFLCGSRSKITVLDIDDTDERLLSDALDRHGKTRIVIKTARHRFQAWYRWNGERRQIRPRHDVPVDILGSGVVVAPNSSNGYSNYEIIEGDLVDIDRLAPIENVETESEEPSAMGHGSGRNNWLFRQLGREAHYCDDFDALVDRAKTLNDQFAIPLDAAEVIRAAKSVWKMTTEGRNRFGQYGAWLPLADVNRLVADPYLCALLSWLKAHNAPQRQFLVADGLRDKFGWPRRQLAKARQRAIDERWIVQVSPPQRGRAASYIWGPRAKTGSDLRSSKKINNVYVEDSLPILGGHFIQPTPRNWVGS